MAAVPIRLCAEQREEALDYHRKVMRAVNGWQGGNYTGLNTPGRFFVGRLAEIALRQWAQGRGLDFEETVLVGQSDMQDFVFRSSGGREFRANIKNTLHPRGRKLMHPIAQTPRIEQQDILIGANGEDTGDGAVIRLWGWVTVPYFLAHAATEHVKVASRTWPLDKLVDMERLVDALV